MRNFILSAEKSSQEHWHHDCMNFKNLFIFSKLKVAIKVSTILVFITMLGSFSLFAQPMTPKLPTAQAGDGIAAVQWRYDGGGTVDGYYVKRSVTSGGPYVTVGSTTNKSYIDNTVTNGTKYYYTVTAYVGVNESGLSPEIWVLPKSTYTLTVNCNSTLGTLPRYEQYHTAIHPMGTSAISTLMEDLNVKYVRNMATTTAWINDFTASYNGTIYGWGAEAVLCIYRPDNKTNVYNALKAIKTAYPSFSYIEVDNEPEINHTVLTSYTTIPTYMERYRAVVEGVQMFHDDPAFSHTPRMKIGGPTVAGCAPNKFVNFGTSTNYPIEMEYIKAFLAEVKNANLPLDFVSWHSYGAPASDLKRQTEDVKAAIAAIGRSNVKTIITEWSGEKGGSGTTNPTAVEAAKPAAYYAAGFYYFLESGADMPMTWAIVNTNNHVKSEMVPGKDGKVYPLYNVCHVYKKLATTRISASSDGHSWDGSGPGVIAAKDGNVVTVMAWNLNSPQALTQVNMSVSNLPFSGSVNVKKYRIDEATSNFVADSLSDKLKLVSTTSVSVTGGAITLPESMKANSVYLLEITPNGSTNIFPTCSISSPANGATFNAPASLTINATATDSDGSITKVEFFQGATKLGEDLTSPYSYSWANVGAGVYSITAKATDNSGALTTSSAINITINNTGTCGSDLTENGTVGVSSTDSPSAEGASKAFDNSTSTKWYARVLTGWISYTFANSAANVVTKYSITSAGDAPERDPKDWKLEGSNDGTNWTTLDTRTGATFASRFQTIEYTISNANAYKSYRLNISAVQNSATASGVQLSELKMFNCGISNVLPTCSISSPATGAIFTAPASVTINANAADSDGTVSKVEFFQGGTKLGEDLSSPYSYSWTNVTAGTYTLTIKATDNTGAVTTSAAVNITVNALPTCGISSPATGATFTAPASITINATAADSDGSVSKVEFYEGTTKLGEDLSTPYSYTWSSVAAGNYNLTVKATDNSGAVTTSSTINVVVNAPVINDFWLEAESCSAGSDWGIVVDTSASNGKGVKALVSYTSAAPGANGQINYPFNVTTAGTYKVWFRHITPTANSNSYWVKMDGGAWSIHDANYSSVWTWDQKSTESYTLSAGSHTLYVGARETDAKIDKIFISRTITPTGKGGVAINGCLKNGKVNNEILSNTEPVKKLEAYPNPTISHLFFTRIVDADLYSLSGTVVKHIDSTDKLDVSDLPKGLYILKTTDGITIKIVKE